MGYEVINTAEETIIRDVESGLKVKVTVNTGTPGTAFCIGTLYTVERSFTPLKVYLFQVISEGDADAQSVKKMAVFFFASLLDTELFIVEIPHDSALFPQEAARIFGGINYERAV